MGFTGYLCKKGALEGTRERLMTRYPYRIGDDTIDVSRILYQHQQWPPAG